MSSQGRGGGGRGGGRGGGDRGRGGGDRGRGGGRGGGGGRGRGGFGGPPQIFSDASQRDLTPNSMVTRTEDAYMAAQKGGSITTALSNLNVGSQFPARPGYGTQGSKVTLYANYFEVVPKRQDVVLHRYNVLVHDKAKPANTPTGKKLKRVFELLLEQDKLAGAVSEFKSMFFLPTNIGSISGLEITYRAEGEDEPSDRPVVYVVDIKHDQGYALGPLLDWLRSSDPARAYGTQLELIQSLNALMGHFPQSAPGIRSVGGSKYFPFVNPVSYQLGEGLVALRGYFKSIRLTTGRILLNVNVSHAVFLPDVPLNVLAKSSYTTRPDAYALERLFKRVRVQTGHLPVRKNKAGQVIPRVKTVLGLADPTDGRGLPNPPKVKKYGAGPKDVQFFLNSEEPSKGAKSGKAGSAKNASGGKYISVWDFFKKTYPNIQQVKTMDENLPVVNVGTRENPAYLPLETCKVMPGQTSRRKLSADQTRNMIQFACRKPAENAQSIMTDGLTALGLTNARNPALVNFGMSIIPSMITVPGRILPPSNVVYLGKKVVPRDGDWNMAGIKFTKGGDLGPWTYLHIRSTKGGHRECYIEEGHLEHDVKTFQKALNSYGVKANGLITPGPSMTVAGPDHRDSNDREIGQWITRVAGNAKKPRFLLIILPYVDTALYNSIKTAADIRAGINTVCVVGSKFSKQPQDRYFANVALKFNLKAGGVNQIADGNKLGIISEGKTMVVGLDVTHPSPGSKEGAPSVAGMVASISSNLAQWPAIARIQESRKEMVTEIGSMFETRLVLWKKHNQEKLPENIIIYRDGVSEGQYETVKKEEEKAIRESCRNIYPAMATEQGLPRLTIAIVGKRHHTRFFPTTEEGASKSSNCKAGTIVDRGVTNVRNWDFFLQAHHCLQGTARPAHYYVILDQIFTKLPKKPGQTGTAADIFEDLTHSMCHLFGRATKTVSLCPPAYYADLLCERARAYLTDYFDPTTPSGTPATTQAGSVAGSQGGAPLPDASRVQLHPALKDTMFYI